MFLLHNTGTLEATSCPTKVPTADQVVAVAPFSRDDFPAFLVIVKLRFIGVAAPQLMMPFCHCSVYANLLPSC